MPSQPLDIQARLAAGWLTFNQFIKVMGMSWPAATRLRKEGRIKTIRIGGTYRVYADEIARILEHGTDAVVCAPEGQEEIEPYEPQPSVFDEEGVNHD